MKIAKDTERKPLCPGYPPLMKALPKRWTCHHHDPRCKLHQLRRCRQHQVQMRISPILATNTTVESILRPHTWHCLSWYVSLPHIERRIFNATTDQSEKTRKVNLQNWFNEELIPRITWSTGTNRQTSRASLLQQVSNSLFERIPAQESAEMPLTVQTDQTSPVLKYESRKTWIALSKHLTLHWTAPWCPVYFLIYFWVTDISLTRSEVFTAQNTRASGSPSKVHYKYSTFYNTV